MTRPRRASGPGGDRRMDRMATDNTTDAECLRPGTGRLIVISGPSGVGKSSIVGQVRTRTGAEFSVSATTREPRAGEQDGRDYHFVDRAAFEKMIADRQLLEWAEVFGDYYGTPASGVRRALAQAKTIILDIDVQGAIQVQRKMPQATFVLIVPPSGAELQHRLAGRGSDTPQAVQRRLAQAQNELRIARESGIYHHTVVNDDLKQAIDKVTEIVTQE